MQVMDEETDASPRPQRWRQAIRAWALLAAVGLGVAMRMGIHPAIDELGFPVTLRSGLIAVLRAQDADRALGSGLVLMMFGGALIWALVATGVAASRSDPVFDGDRHGVRALRGSLLVVALLSADLLFKPLGLLELGAVAALACSALSIFALVRDKDRAAAGWSAAILAVAVVYVLTSPDVPFCAINTARVNVKACFANQKTIEGALEMFRVDHPGGEEPALDLSALVKDQYLQCTPDDPGGGAGSSTNYHRDGPWPGIACSVHGSHLRPRERLRR